MGTAGAGRDHWDYAQFVLAAGCGFRRGCVVGATDRNSDQVTDNFYKVESFEATLYHLLGIDLHTVVNTLNYRPPPHQRGPRSSARRLFDRPVTTELRYEAKVRGDLDYFCFFFASSAANFWR